MRFKVYYSPVPESVCACLINLCGEIIKPALTIPIEAVWTKMINAAKNYYHQSFEIFVFSWNFKSVEKIATNFKLNIICVFAVNWMTWSYWVIKNRVSLWYVCWQLYYNETATWKFFFHKNAILDDHLLWYVKSQL